MTVMASARSLNFFTPPISLMTSSTSVTRWKPPSVWIVWATFLTCSRVIVSPFVAGFSTTAGDCLDYCRAFFTAFFAVRVLLSLGS